MRCPVTTRPMRSTSRPGTCRLQHADSTCACACVCAREKGNSKKDERGRSNGHCLLQPRLSYQQQLQRYRGGGWVALARAILIYAPSGQTAPSSCSVTPKPQTPNPPNLHNRDRGTCRRSECARISEILRLRLREAARIGTTTISPLEFLVAVDVDVHDDDLHLVGDTYGLAARAPREPEPSLLARARCGCTHSGLHCDIACLLAATHPHNLTSSHPPILDNDDART